MIPTRTRPVEDLLRDAEWMRALARRLVSDRDQVEDAVQDAWVVALEQRSAPRESAHAWLSGVFRNLARQQWRSERARRQREQSVARAEALPSTADVVERAQAQRGLVDAVLALDEPYRSTILLHYFDDLTAEEIARRQDEPSSTVRNRLSRGIAQLRQKLERQGGASWAVVLAPLAGVRAPDGVLTAAGTPSGALTSTALVGGLAMSVAAKVAVGLVTVAAIGWFVWPRDDIEGASALTGILPTQVSPALADVEDESDTSRIEARVRSDNEPVPALTQPSSSRATLRVLVLAKETQAPLARIRVSVDHGEPGSSARDADRSSGTLADALLTDEGGHVEFDLAPGKDLHVWVHPEHGEARNANVVVPALAGSETREHVVHLETAPDRVFHGRVLSRATREPIAGATITLEGLLVGGEPHESETAPDGRFRVELRSWAILGLRIDAAGFGRGWAEPVAGYETPEGELEILLDRSSSIRVTARAADGSPIVGARAVLEAWNGEIASTRTMGHRALEATSWSVVTGADGVATFQDLPVHVELRGELRDEKRLLWREPDPMTLKPDETRDLTWRVGVGAEVRGVVVEKDGTPVARQVVWLQRATQDSPTMFRIYDESQGRHGVRTNADGTFRFKDVGAGPWWVGPAVTEGKPNPETDPAPLGQLVEVPASNDIVDVRIELVRGIVIRGRVVAPDGITPAKASVMGYRPGQPMYVDQRVPSASEFVLGPLLPGRWSLQAMAGFRYAPSEVVEVEAGAVDVVLRLEESTTVHLTVVDADGAPVNGANILVSTAERTHVAVTPASGVMEIPDIGLGEFQASATLPDGRWAARSGLVAAPGRTTTVELALQPGARGRLDYATGPPHATVMLVRDGVTILLESVKPLGSVSLRGPEGPSTLRLLFPGGATTERQIVLSREREEPIVYDSGWK